MPRTWLWVANPDRCFDGPDLYADLCPGGQEPGDWWSCDEATAAGDQALLYVTRPFSTVLALIDVRSPAREARPYEVAEKRWPWVCDYAVAELFDKGATYRSIVADAELDHWRSSCRNFQGVAFEVPPTIWRKLLYVSRAGKSPSTPAATAAYP